MQWLPHTINAQWIYLLYRAVVCFYFVVWFILSTSINASSPNLLIFLTQWSFITLSAYLLVSLVTTANNFILVYVYPKKKCVRSFPDNTDDDDTVYDDINAEDEMSKDCCHGCTRGDRITLCDKLTWLLFLVGTESALLTVLLYWAFSGKDAEKDISVSVNIHTHILNGVVALLEVWVTGIPIHLLQFIYTLLFVGTYGVFTGVHYGVNSTDFGSEEYIYPILDYGSEPYVAAAAVIIGVLVVCPLLHLFLYLQCLLRQWLTTYLQRHFDLYHRYFDPIYISTSSPIPIWV